MGTGRREGTAVDSRFSCPLCHLNLDSLETDFFVVVVGVLGGLDAVNGDSTSPASPQT